MEGLSDYQKAQKWLERVDWDNDPEADEILRQYVMRYRR